eukprot:SAG22_NODE_330_length_12211_cov_6.451948_14_plen_86_part_00
MVHGSPTRDRDSIRTICTGLVTLFVFDIQSKRLASFFSPRASPMKLSCSILSALSSSASISCWSELANLCILLPDRHLSLRRKEP